MWLKCSNMSLNGYKTKSSFPIAVKGGHLDFSHLTELKKIYICITKIYIKKKKNPIQIIHN